MRERPPTGGAEQRGDGVDRGQRRPGRTRSGSPRSWLPKSSPKIQATRSNSAIATRPQLSPPTISRAPASTSSFLMLCTSCRRLFRSATVGKSRAPLSSDLYRCCIVWTWRRGEVLRIGELSKRVGVSPELLRAWERRYGLLTARCAQPAAFACTRSPTSNGWPDAAAPRRGDGRRARRPRSPCSAASARRLPGPRWRPGGGPRRARGALDEFDEPRAQAVLDRLLAVATWRRCSAKWCCRTCTSSASGGSAASRRSPRSTSPRA